MANTRKKTKLTKSQITELVVHALELNQSGSSRVIYDAQIPELMTGKQRQVDVAVFGVASGRLFLRIVEVRDRSRPVSVEFVDQVQGKQAALGAHRVTIVSTAGYTTAALDRIRSTPHTMDAFELRPGQKDQWPARFPGFEIALSDQNGITDHVPLSHSRYVEAIKDELIYDVLYGTWQEAKMVFCLLLPPELEREGRFGILDRGGSHRITGATMDLRYSDGRTERQTIGPTGLVTHISATTSQ